MAKATKTHPSAVTGKLVTMPIGTRKAAKFAEVDGLKMGQNAKALSQKLMANGLKGDAYRAEITRAFKKG